MALANRPLQWSLMALLATGACAAAPSPSLQIASATVERFAANPIIAPDMLPDSDGENINGPSLIRVPDWVDGAMGRYYLYFAHHEGTYIRLAYADDLAGPWTVHAPGTLRLEDTVCNDLTASSYASYKHVASPDVHVDTEHRQIRMYFHCAAYVGGPADEEDSYQQVTFAAVSRDGLNFTADSAPLGNSYFRMFRWNDAQYAVGMPGVFYRSADGLSGFEEGPTLFTPDMRHAAVLVRDHLLHVLYSVAGDNPERILIATIDLGPDWSHWAASDPAVLLEPERDWEGANLPSAPSLRGRATSRVRQLRDPAIFEEEGRTYLLYSVAGESGIAIGEIHWP